MDLLYHSLLRKASFFKEKFFYKTFKKHLTIGITYDIMFIVIKENHKYRGKTRKEVNMDAMGMTDKQFNGFVRFILDDIKEVLETLNDGKEKEKLEKVAENLQKTLED